MTQRNDGGPAYPIPDPFHLEPKNVEETKRLASGMSLRDAMALSVRMPDEYALSWAETILGEKAPQANGIKAAPIDQCIDFWMRAEAAYRYRMADALLAARGRT